MGVQDIRKINEVIVENAERWANDGWGGLYGVDDNKGVVFLAFNTKLNLKESKESLKSLTDYFESVQTDAAPFTAKFLSLASHWEAQNQPEMLGFLASEAGVTLTRSSRLVHSLSVIG